MHDIKPSHPRSKHHIMHYLHRCACYKYVVGIYFLHNGMQHAQSGAEFLHGGSGAAQRVAGTAHRGSNRAHKELVSAHRGQPARIE